MDTHTHTHVIERGREEESTCEVHNAVVQGWYPNLRQF